MQRLLEHLGRGTSELSILLTDDEGISDYNRRFLGREGPTNVISFGVDDTFADGPDVVGDIAVNIDAAVRQSKIRGVSPTEEIIILSVHGLLHLLGHIHDPREGASAQDEESMEREQRRLLRTIGIIIE